MAIITKPPSSCLLLFSTFPSPSSLKNPTFFYPNYNKNHTFFLVPPQKTKIFAINATPTSTKSPPGFQTHSNDTNDDPISILNERIRREQGGKRVHRAKVVDSRETDKYIQMVKLQQQRGLQKLKSTREASSSSNHGFSYKVDPYTLSPGDYVVHKKVGIGRFVGIKYDVGGKNDSRGGGAPIEYVFIEYADGMAKLPVNQACRFLYRYNLYVYSPCLLFTLAHKQWYFYFVWLG